MRSRKKKSFPHTPEVIHPDKSESTVEFDSDDVAERSVESHPATQPKEHSSKTTQFIKQNLFSHPKRLFLIPVGVLVMAVIFLAGLELIQPKPKDTRLYDAPGPLVFQKVNREANHADPDTSSPQSSYEPADFQLFDNGNIVCSHNEGHEHNTSTAFHLTGGKLTKAQQATFRGDLKQAGFSNTKPLLSGNSYDDYKHNDGRIVYNYIDNGKARSVIYVKEPNNNKPEQLTKIDQLITEACNTYAKEAYKPEVVALTMHNVADSANLAKLPEASLTDLTRNSHMKKQLDDLTKQKSPYPLNEVTYSQADKDTLLNMVFKGNTMVRLATPQGTVILTYQPSVPTDGDINTQNANLYAYEIKSIGNLQETYVQSDKLGMSDKVIKNVADLLQPKAAARTNMARHFSIHYLQFNDGPHDVTEDQMRSAAGALANWYKWELSVESPYNSTNNFSFEAHVENFGQDSSFVTSCHSLSPIQNLLCEDDRRLNKNMRGVVQDNVFAKYGGPIRDPYSLDVYVIDDRLPVISYLKTNDSKIDGGFVCGWSDTPSNASFILWGKDSPGTCGARAVTQGYDDYQISKLMAHETGHGFGLVHTHEIGVNGNIDGLPHDQAHADIENYQTVASAPFPANIDGLQGATVGSYANSVWIHLSTIQRQFILGTFGGSAARIAYPGSNTLATPPSQPPTPSVPTCGNGNPIDPKYYCDDGNWSLIYSGPAGKWYFELWQNPAGQCGTKTGSPSGTLPQVPTGYMYAQDCDSVLNFIKVAIANAAINQIGPKINAIQDVKPLGGGTRIQSRTTNPVYQNFNARKGALTTWPTYVKPDQGPIVNYFPGYLPLPNFIQDPHGYMNINSPENTWGNVFGYIDGRFAATSNQKPGQPFIFGPFENPGGNVNTATQGGRKAMKVCWTIKDIRAAETNNSQHSYVQLQVTSNGGSHNYTYGPYSVYQLNGTAYSTYCQDNIHISGGDTANLEYPVTLVSGAVAVSDISREIYWPEAQYWTWFPSKTRFEADDPIVKQANTSLANNKCDYDETAAFASAGCPLSDRTSIGITSATFGAPKKNGYKQVCVVASNLSAGHALWAYVYPTMKSMPAVLTLKPAEKDWFGRQMYCANHSADNKSFQQIVIATSSPQTAPVMVHGVGVR